MEMCDTKKTAEESLDEDCRVDCESEDKLTKARENQPVRPKKFLVPPYAHRQRETRIYELSLGENKQPQTDDLTNLSLNKVVDDRKMVSSRLSRFGSPTIPTQPKPTFKTLGNANKYVSFPSRPLSKATLEELDRETPGTVAEVFHKRHDDFVKVLKMCSKDKHLIKVLLSILSKITKSAGDHFIDFSSVLRQSLFIENIVIPYLLSLLGRGSDNVVTVRHAIGILRYITEHSYTSITSFFSVFTILFDLSQEIRASDLCTPDLKAELDVFDQLRSKLNAMRLRQRKKVQTKEDQMLPPNSFRLINISPTADELLTNRAPFLRKNKDIGSYIDLDHYLDVQFRLLREDFVAPLRESIEEFKNNMQYLQDGTRKVQDIRIYSGVKIAGTTTSYVGICHVLTFDTSKTKRVKWEFSKRLVYGSLLCLSCDNFQTIYFATVTQRDPFDLNLGMLDVQFMCELETVRSMTGKEFIMAESSTYFEAYKHNLRALQLIKDLPFSQYIVECRDDINPPAYLMAAEENQYDLSVLDKDFADDKNGPEKDFRCGSDIRRRQTLNAVTRKCDKTLESVNVLNDSSWPSISRLGLDDSQYRALKNALTHEFSITQGPPGTGKTFIGLKVARVLLANKALWSARQKQPLLVVCYTNHALDQFLCGIYSFYKGGDIVRIGGRSTNEEMQQHGIDTMYKYITSDVRMASTVARETADRTEKRINDLKDQIYRLDRNIVMTDHLTKYMGRFQKPLEAGFEQKVRGLNKRNWNNAPEQLDMVLEWLGHGVLQSYPEIEVHFADIDLERKTLVHDSTMKNNEHQASYDYTLKTTSRYYEQVGCMSKNIIRSAKGQASELKRLKNDLPNSVAYHDIVPMNKTSKERIRKIWKLSFHKRWELYKSWVEELKHDLTEILKEYEDNFLQCCKDMQNAKRDKDIEALRQADVIGMTTTGAAKHYEVLQSIKPKIVIVEEAAEVLEGHIITSLSDECEHLILIGDHKQLKPSPTVYQLAKKYKLDLSLFERMINNKVNHEKLEIQHRMRPEIANIIRLIYPYLKDHEIVLNKPDIRGVSRNVYFITHKHSEEEEEDTLSHLNKYEAEFVVGLCRYLLKQQYKPSQITVLTTYKAQMFYLQRLMPKNSEFAGVNITVVDNYQGEENEIILLSLVRSNASKKVGFLKTENRVNVALSRARNGLYVIGNLELFADASVTWAKIVEQLQKENQIGPAIPLFCRNHSDTKLCAQTIKDFEKAPEGGCNLNCDARLECGHVCELKCHVYDMDHKEYKCQKSCIRSCKSRHPCFKKCFEDCGECEVPVVNMMPECGHEQTMPCFQDPVGWDCKAMCERMCKRKHPCKKRCYEDCSVCEVEIVKAFRRCGHKVIAPCGMERGPLKCKQDCEHICKNGHKCNKMCYENCENCEVIYQRKLIKCGHDQLIPCFMDESEWKCNAYCEQKCKNNHKCKKLCSDDCNCTIEMTKEMPDCKHVQLVPCNVKPSNWKCKAPCDGKLDCGHECPSLCSDTLDHNSKCTKEKSRMKEVLDLFKKAPIRPRANALRNSLHIHSSNDRCDKMCEFTLKCGHKCPRKCYQRCSESHTRLCTEEIEKRLPCCKRILLVQCREDIELVKCPFPCQEKLKCGHHCTNKCSDPHTSVCKVLVDKTLPCGHVQNLHCGVNIDTIQCFRHCKTVLLCGHGCKNRCVEPHTSECQEIVNYKCNYGHKATAPCHKIYTKFGAQCHHRCRQKIACGHICSGTCFECKGGVLHKACSDCPLPDLKTHTSSMKAREGYPCLAKCQNRCDHKICEKMCFEPCAEDGQAKWPCEEKCNSECEHFNCQKQSIEQQENKVCSDTYEMITRIAENINKPRDIKRHADIKKSHKSCGAQVDAVLVEGALKQHVKHHQRKTKEVNAATYAKIAGNLHEFEE